MKIDPKNKETPSLDSLRLAFITGMAVRYNLHADEGSKMWDLIVNTARVMDHFDLNGDKDGHGDTEETDD